MFSISINFEDIEHPAINIYNVMPGTTMLELALEHNIALKHDCGGICSCGTCLLIVNRGENFLTEMDRREMHLLRKVASLVKNARLSCQCVIINGKGIIEVTIPIKNHNIK